jgi:hypothetical protein
MRDSLDDLEMDLGRLPDSRNTDTASPSAAQQIRRALRGRHVCPFCGTQRETDVGPCTQCSLEDTPTTRSATRGKLGPWYVLQSRNPSAPGMNFATLMVLVQKGRVTARSVLRGPTTGQFWRHAAKVKGVSREFLLCWNCGSDIAKNARACPNCKRLQEPPLNPDVLLESGEFSSEELAEAMWSDQPAESSQMGAPPMPRPVPSPVDRLVSRGGVRRELPAQSFDAPPGALPARPQRGLLNENEVEDLPHAGLEMAVFQRPKHPQAPRPARGLVGKIFKSLFVAVILAGLGVAAMCTLDEGFRLRCKGFAVRHFEQARSWINGGDGSNHSLPTPQGHSRADAQPVVQQRVQRPVEIPRASETPLERPTRVVTPPSPSHASAVPAQPTLEQSKMRVWELWKAGVNAEKENDFAGAVKSWEAIKALPVTEDDLPMNLDARISAAKRHLR